MTQILDNCRLDLEDRSLLQRLPELPAEFLTYSRPAEVGVDWHKPENQGPIGSCQGNDLTSCAERLQFVRTRDKAKVVQLSRIFAYLATQKIDGLLGRGDVGSTITGGCKLLLTSGAPPEELTSYPSSYPSRSSIERILSAENYKAGEPYKAVSTWKVPEDPEESMNFIGGGGAISIGIAWYSGLIPRDRIVKSFSPSGRTGGHAMAVLGYTTGGNLVAVNSHGDGKYEITPNAWRQIVRHQRSACVGLVGTSEPTPVDWISSSPWSD